MSEYKEPKPPTIEFEPQIKPWAWAVRAAKVVKRVRRFLYHRANYRISRLFERTIHRAQFKVIGVVRHEGFDPQIVEAQRGNYLLYKLGAVEHYPDYKHASQELEFDD